MLLSRQDQLEIQLDELWHRTHSIKLRFIFQRSVKSNEYYQHPDDADGNDFLLQLIIYSTFIIRFAIVPNEMNLRDEWDSVLHSSHHLKESFVGEMMMIVTIWSAWALWINKLIDILFWMHCCTNGYHPLRLLAMLNNGWIKMAVRYLIEIKDILWIYFILCAYCRKSNQILIIQVQ